MKKRFVEGSHLRLMPRSTVGFILDFIQMSSYEETNGVNYCIKIKRDFLLVSVDDESIEPRTSHGVQWVGGVQVHETRLDSRLL